MKIQLIRHLLIILALHVAFCSFPSVVRADEDLDRWVNVESWEGSFTVTYHQGSYLNYRYSGTLELNDKQIYKRRRQTEWKGVRWKGELKAAGNYEQEIEAEDIRALISANGPASHGANLKIDKRRGIYDLNLGFVVLATQKTWYK
ncbi:MAG: hypothetical protein P1P81_08460, partial [Desulfobulbales bacterium]|nr:hypothetical protein [Desulfobulbales bacterium]